MERVHRLREIKEINKVETGPNAEMRETNGVDPIIIFIFYEIRF